jgi:hypothetical protein
MQMSNPHSSWIDQVPIPRLRDNLIKRQVSFDHREFLEDLLGELVDRTRFHQDTPRANMLSQNPSERRIREPPFGAGDDGLIVWGEPHLEESWEVTRGFLKRWAWALEGCVKLIERTNRWRAKRGEYPIFPVCQMNAWDNDKLLNTPT